MVGLQLDFPLRALFEQVRHHGPTYIVDQRGRDNQCIIVTYRFGGVRSNIVHSEDMYAAGTHNQLRPSDLNIYSSFPLILVSVNHHPSPL